MDQEQQYTKFQYTLPDDNFIINLFTTTFTSSNTSQISNAQIILNNLIKNNLFIEKLFSFLQNQQLNIEKQGNQFNYKQYKNIEQFKQAISVQIKKFSYGYSKQQNTNKQNVINKLFYLLISKLNTKSKQQLGTALEYILNHDSIDQYRHKVITKVVQLINSQPNQTVLQGLVIVSLSCINSLIQADQQFQFFYQVYNPFTINLMKIMGLLTELLQQNYNLNNNPSMKILIKLCQRIFDFFQLTISRLIEEEDYIQDKITTIRNNINLQTLLFTYLSNFNYNKSLISTIPQINSIKQIIIQIVALLYKQKPMPQNIFNLLFITFLLQSNKLEYQLEQTSILSKILEIMQNYLKNKLYLETFGDHKMQLMMSLLMYLSTKPQEIDMIQDQPQKFIELSEDIIDPVQRANSIKVKAASFLKIFVSKFDQALKNIIQINVIIITTALQSNKQNSPCLQLYKNLQQQFPQFPFFKLDISLQLQTSFLILSILNQFINKRQDLYNVVYAILITYIDSLKTLQQPIVLLRLIRLIGYYPTAAYYDFIKQKMGKGKVFVLEGLKTFQRILKANRHPELFAILADIFSELINLIHVSDSIFETIILNHYERILKKNLNLYRNFLMKIRDTFIESIEKKQHISLVSLGYVYSILYKEDQPQYRQQVIKYFYEMQDYHKKLVLFYKQKSLLQQDPPQIQNYKKLLKNLSHYQQKIIDVYCIIAKKQISISQRTLNFALESLKKLKQFNRNDQIWRFYNNILLKFDNFNNQVQIFFKAFMNEIFDIFGYLLDNSQPINSDIENVIQLIPNFCFLISQIIATYYNYIQLQQSHIINLLKIIKTQPQSIRQYLLFIIITYLYVQPVKLKQILVKNNIYQDSLKSFLRIYYSDKLIRKVFLLSMTKLLQIQEEYFEDIIRECLIYYKEQHYKNQIKRNNKNRENYDPKLRRMFSIYQNDLKKSQEEQMIEQCSKQQVNSTSYQNLKHPFQNLSQYQHFKIRMWQNPQILQKLEQNIKNQVRPILQMDWVGKKVRQIFTVKQKQEKNSFF